MDIFQRLYGAERFADMGHLDNIFKDRLLQLLHNIPPSGKN